MRLKLDSLTFLIILIVVAGGVFISSIDFDEVVSLEEKISDLEAPSHIV